MHQTMKISIAKKPVNAGVVAVRHLTVREKLLRLLLGAPVKTTVIVPGDTVEAIAITEVPADAT